MKILLIVYDNGSYIHYFPMGTAYVASALKRAGHEVIVWNQDMCHYPESILKSSIERQRPDVVGLGFVANYYTYKKSQAIAEAVNSCKPRPRFILGGHGPSSDPAFFMNKLGADAVVCGEGEWAVMQAIEMDGIFRSPLIVNIDDIPFPDYSQFPINYYALKRESHTTPTDRVMPIITARGCPYQCNFCYRMDEGYRMHSIEHVMEEIKYLVSMHGINYIDFADELTVPYEKRGTEICEALFPLKLKWMCNGRLNVAAKHPDLLKLMKRAGCVFINYGIEALDDEVLKTMHKQQTVEQIHKGIENTLAAGISPGFNIIFGHIGDTKKNLDKAVDFILKHDDFGQRRTMLPVTPYPGTELFRYCVSKGLLTGTEDFFEKHVNADLPTVNLTDLTYEEFCEALYEANTTLLKNYYRRQFEDAVETAQNIYLKRNPTFRGFRH